MDRDVTNVKYKDHHPKKKVKKGNNNLELIGTDLELVDDQELTIQMVSVVNSNSTLWTWDVDQPKPEDITSNLIKFKAKLNHNPRPGPKGGRGNDTGDLTITLLYTDEDSLPVDCDDVKDVEHEP